MRNAGELAQLSSAELDSNDGSQVQLRPLTQCYHVYRKYTNEGYGAAPIALLCIVSPLRPPNLHSLTPL